MKTMVLGQVTEGMGLELTSYPMAIQEVKQSIYVMKLH